MSTYPFVHDSDTSRRFFVFDMFETLVRNVRGDFEPVFEALCTFYPDVEPSDIDDCYRVFAHSFREANGDRELPIDSIIRHLDSTFGYCNDPVAMERPLLRDNRIFRLGEGVEEALGYLKDRGYRIAVLSNTRYHDFTLRGILEDEGISDLVDVIVTSADTGWRKPAAEAYAAVLDTLGARASECFFCGDNPGMDYHGPLAAGMKGAVHLDYDGNGDIIHRIGSMGKLPGLFERADR